MSSRTLTKKEVEDLKAGKLSFEKEEPLIKNECKNKCGKERRHASAYCQECSDQFNS